jgi:hypothetical protein
MSISNAWRTYEEVAQLLLNSIAAELGLSHVEGKQDIAGKLSGTTWEIDAKGVSSGSDGFVLVEVRRHTTKGLSQESLAALAYRIQDTGASGGIVVTPLPLQVGAAKVAASSGVVSVQLNEHSTTEQYLLRFLNRVMVGLPAETISVGARLTGGTLTTVIPQVPDANSDA